MTNTSENSSHGSTTDPLEQLRELTGLSLEEARRLLDIAAGSLDVAVSLHFEQQDAQAAASFGPGDNERSQSRSEDPPRSSTWQNSTRINSPTVGLAQNGDAARDTVSRGSGTGSIQNANTNNNNDMETGSSGEMTWIRLILSLTNKATSFIRSLLCLPVVVLRFILTPAPGRWGTGFITGADSVPPAVDFEPFFDSLGAREGSHPLIQPKDAVGLNWYRNGFSNALAESSRAGKPICMVAAPMKQIERDPAARQSFQRLYLKVFRDLAIAETLNSRYLTYGCDIDSSSKVAGFLTSLSLHISLSPPVMAIVFILPFKFSPLAAHAVHCIVSSNSNLLSQFSLSPELLNPADHQLLTRTAASAASSGVPLVVSPLGLLRSSALTFSKTADPNLCVSSFSKSLADTEIASSHFTDRARRRLVDSETTRLLREQQESEYLEALHLDQQRKDTQEKNKLEADRLNQSRNWKKSALSEVLKNRRLNINKFKIIHSDCETFNAELSRLENAAHLILRLSPSGCRLKMIVESGCLLTAVADVLSCLDDIVCFSSKTAGSSASQSSSSIRKMDSSASQGSSSAVNQISVILKMPPEGNRGSCSGVVVVFNPPSDAPAIRLLGPKVLVKSAEPILNQMMAGTLLSSLESKHHMAVQDSQLYPNSVLHISSDYSAGSVFEFLPGDPDLASWWNQTKA